MAKAKKSAVVPDIGGMIRKVVKQGALHPERIMPKIDELVKQHPASSTAWLVKAQLHLALGQHREAQRCLKSLEKLDPLDPRLDFENAEIALSNQDAKNAAAFITNGIFYTVDGLRESLEILFGSDTTASTDVMKAVSGFTEQSLKNNAKSNASAKKVSSTVDRACKRVVKSKMF